MPYNGRKGLITDAKNFVSNCLICKLSSSGAQVPRLISQTLHADLPGKILHFDYLILKDGEDNHNYVFVLKEELNGYTWLNESKSTIAEHAAEVLFRWQRTFTPPHWWVSDQNLHFINELMSSMAKHSASNIGRQSLTIRMLTER